TYRPEVELNEGRSAARDRPTASCPQGGEALRPGSIANAPWALLERPTPNRPSLRASARGQLSPRIPRGIERNHRRLWLEAAASQKPAQTAEIDGTQT